MCGLEVPDKDGVSAAVYLASLSSHLQQQGRGLLDQLDWLYSQYGFHISENSYFICHDKEVLKNIFARLRNYNGSGKVCPTGSYLLYILKILSEYYFWVQKE